MTLGRIAPGGKRIFGDSGRRPGRARGRLHYAEPNRLTRERHAPPLATLCDPELVVEVEQMLLDGRRGDDQLRGDLSHRGGLRDHVVAVQRPTEGDQHVLLAPGQLGLAHRCPRATMSNPIVGLTRR